MTGRVISELTTRAKDGEEYQKFWENFGPVLKEGIYEDFERRGEIAPLLRFRSSAVEGWTSLPDYVSRMKDGQESIFYLVADDAEALRSSPQLEGFKARGLEVLLLSDHVDAFWPDQMRTFEEKTLRSITQGGLDLSKFAPEGEASEAPEGIEAFVAAVKAALGADVSDVRTTDRLVDSAVVLSSGANGPDLQMQRLMRRAGAGGRRAAGAGDQPTPPADSSARRRARIGARHGGRHVARPRPHPGRRQPARSRGLRTHRRRGARGRQGRLGLKTVGLVDHSETRRP